MRHRPAGTRAPSPITAVLALTLAGGIAIGAQGSQATPPPPPSGLVLGQVIDAQTNRPVGRATVTLAVGRIAPALTLPGQAGPQQVIADAEGRFVFRALAAGSYTFSAAATGYLTGNLGQRRPEGAGQPFDLVEGQRTGDLIIRLWRAATIGGTVVDESGHPVGEVSVQIVRRTSAGGRAVLSPQPTYTRTDDRGVYRRSNLPPGDYLVAVASSITASRAQLANPDKPQSDLLQASGAFSLAAPQGFGPAVRVGELIIQTSRQSGGTDALAGTLPLSVLPDGRIAAYPTTFHPSAASPAEAGVIALGPGDERMSVDVQLRPIPLAPLTGTALTPEGPASGLAIHLIPAYAVHTMAERTFEVAVTVTDRAGRFVFPAVAPGTYVIEAWRKPSAYVSLIAPASSEPAWWAEQRVTIGAQPVNVGLTLAPGARISGRIVLEGTTAPPPPRGFQAMLGAWFQPPWPLAYTQGPLGETRVSETWEFTREGSPPGQYPPAVSLTSFSPPVGWYLKSATHQGSDLMTNPLRLDGHDVSDVVLTFTDRPTSLSGVVTGPDGKPDTNASVLVFPAEYQAGIDNGMPAIAARTVVVSQSGRYAIDDLRPGTFLVVASGMDLLDRWQDPVVLRGLVAGATRVTLTSGTRNTQDLRSR
ncbi:MAG: carboxypeptidase-like regulatory domain-containing protein [Vicinamibacterales bacterium]